MQAQILRADARQITSRILKMCSYTVQRCAPSWKSLDCATASRRAVISALVDMLCLVWSNACMHAKVHLNVPSDANHALSTGIKMRCRLLGDRRCFVRIMQPTQGGIWALMQTFCAKKHSFGAAVPLLLRTSFQDIHSAYARAQFSAVWLVKKGPGMHCSLLCPEHRRSYKTHVLSSSILTSCAPWRRQHRLAPLQAAASCSSTQPACIPQIHVYVIGLCSMLIHKSLLIIIYYSVEVLYFVLVQMCL